jgi:UDP-galactopyranose mutase
MKTNKRFILSFVAPFMIFMSAIGFILSDKTRKNFYLPIGLMGISIILEKEIKRRLDRENILKKIKSYQKIK